MSTYTSEPGTRLAGRYRLVDQTSAGTGWTFWKATDETLARSVTVLTFAPGFPRIAEAITAARAVARLSDPRFSQVFDVEDAGELAYVVMEWVVGESLLGMLADGPLDPPHAVSLLSEAAQAVAAAHAIGLAHLRLTPACLHWTRGSGVKITGLGIDAVLAGTATAEDGAELTDTQDLGRLLYAALTGYWPGSLGPSGPLAPLGLPGSAEAAEAAEAAEPDDALARAGATGLPPAPEVDGEPRTPRQVSAAVPANIDALTCQALFQRPSRHGPALTTPAMLAEALGNVAPPDPPPVPAPSTSPFGPPTERGYQPSGPTSTYPTADPPARPRAGTPYHRPPGDRSSTRAVIVSAVIVIVLVAAGIVGWTLSHRSSPATTAPPTTLTTISTEMTRAITPKAMMNGTQGATPDCSDVRMSR